MSEEDSPEYKAPPTHNDDDDEKRNMAHGKPEYRSASLNAEQNANGKTQLMFSPGILDSVTMGFNHAVSGFTEYLKSHNGDFVKYGILFSVIAFVVWVVLLQRQQL